jgi:hypothetical protein
MTPLKGENIYIIHRSFRLGNTELYYLSSKKCPVFLSATERRHRSFLLPNPDLSSSPYLNRKNPYIELHLEEDIYIEFLIRIFE